MDPIRFTGLASGLDTQSIVDELMKAARIPLDNKEKDKQLLEWKRDDYREMNSKLAELDDSIFNGIGKQSTFIQKMWLVLMRVLFQPKTLIQQSKLILQLESIR